MVGIVCKYSDAIEKGMTCDESGNIYKPFHYQIPTNIMHAHKHSLGYRYVSYGPYKLYIHRLVAMILLPNPENKATVNHKDGDKTNNAVSNLEWATRSENSKHAWDTGLQSKNRYANRRLTTRQVRAIRLAYLSGTINQSKLAHKYGLSQVAMSNIINGKTYRDIV